jgi:16S rRNA (adenine1518-N6/adenine1519-N6)-dimethyltransferase
MTQARLPTRKRDWQRLIAEIGLRPNKGRGQNFLHDLGVVHRIVRAADVGGEDHCLEIGPGLGIMTHELVARAGQVTAIELDAALAGHLERTFAGVPGFHLIQGDALKIDLAEALGPEPVKVVANLPYSAAAAIVQHVLEAAITLESVTVMVQREVAERMLANPPDMSILSVATQVSAEGTIDFLVPPDVFIPSPAVESAVLTLTPHSEPLISQKEREPFFRLVNAGFRHKRKNIANSIADETRLEKSEVLKALSSAGIDPVRRAQTLTVAEWIGLMHAWDREIVAA